MRQTGTTKSTDLAKFLDLQKFQDKRLHDFYKLFKRFCNFADPSMGCSEMTERSLLCFFDLMENALSNEHFIMSFSQFLKNLEKKMEEGMWHRFLDDLQQNSEFHSIILNIGY